MASATNRRRKAPGMPGLLGTRTVTVYDPVTGSPVQATARVYRAPTDEEREDRDWLRSSWRCSILGVGQSQMEEGGSWVTNRH